jgi:site-specific DNA recombinase
MIRAGLYARVSTANQEDEKTINSQIAEVKAKIKEDGNYLVPDCIYIDDGYTGEILERPDLDRMRDDAKDRKFDALYVWDRGRLSRKFVHQEILVEELKSLEVEFISLKDASADSPDEKLMQMVQGVFHEYEKVKIYDRFRRGKSDKVGNGKLLGYNPKYGYRYVPKIKKEREGYFVVDEKEARVVRMIFSWVGEEKMAINGVIRKLYELKIPPKKNKRPVWTKGPISNMLKDSTYTGLHYYNKTEAILTENSKKNKVYRKVNKTGRRIRPKEEWIPIKVPAIISKELFDKVQVQLKLNSKYASRNCKTEYLLGGVVYCSCGRRRTGEGLKGHYYYRCTDRLHHFPMPRKCHEAGVNAQVADVFAWKEIYKLLSRPKLLEAQAKRWVESRNGRQQNDLELAGIDNELKRLDEEEKRYTEGYGAGVTPFEVYKESMEQAKDRRNFLLSQRCEIESRQRQKISIPPQRLAELAQTTIAGFNFDDKRAIIRQLVEKVVATREKLTITGYIPINLSKYMELSHADRNRRTAECW